MTKAITTSSSQLRLDPLFPPMVEVVSVTLINSQ